MSDSGETRIGRMRRERGGAAAISTSCDETLGYLSRSFGRLGFSIQDERDLTARG